MKKHILFGCLLLLCTALKSSAQALPDPFPEPPSNSNFYYQNLGQILGTDGNPQPNIKYYTERTFPKMYFSDDAVHFTAFVAADTSVGSDDSLFRIDMKFLCEPKQLASSSAPNTRSSLACGTLKSYEQGQDHLNYYLPHCPSGITDVPGFARLVYENVFDDIDVHFYSNSLAMKVYFVVKPGGDPSDIELLFSGQDSIGTLTSGSLAMYLRSWSLQFPQAIAYQIDASNNIIPVTSWLPTWNHIGGGQVNISVGPYNPSETLVIGIGDNDHKPNGNDNLDWSIYYGDVGSDDFPRILANDESVYHVLCQSGGNFPLIPGATNVLSFAGGQDWYVSKFTTEGVRKWATYYGGTYSEFADALAIGSFHGEKDYEGLWAAGYTLSSNVPLGIENGVFKQTANWGSNPQFNRNGLLAFFNGVNGYMPYGTYFGAGNDVDEYITDMTVDPVSNSLFIVGSTEKNAVFDNSCSTPSNGSFPLCSGPGSSFFQGSKHISNDKEGFIAQFDLSNNMELVWSTLFGGPGEDNIKSLKAVNNGNERSLYIGGVTSCTSVGSSFPSPVTGNPVSTFPLANPGNGAFFQKSTFAEANTSHNFLAKFSFLQGGFQLEWSTFFGRSKGGIKNIELNSQGQIYVAGDGVEYTSAASSSQLGNASGRVPVYDNGISHYETPADPNQNTILARFDENKHLQWGTYLFGGANTQYAPYLQINRIGLAIDNSDRVFITPHFMLPAPAITYNPNSEYVQPHSSAGIADNSRYDGYIMAFSGNEVLTWATFFGGADEPPVFANPNLYSSFDNICDISVNGNDQLFVTGATRCPNSPYHKCPAFPGYCDETYAGSEDCHISRFEVSGLPSVTGVSDPSKEIFSLVCYPNPATDLANLQFINSGKQSKGTVTISDLAGRNMSTYNIGLKQGVNLIKIPFNNLSAGIYLLEINNGSGKAVAKIVKQ